MKQKKSVIIIAALIIAAFVTRLVQIFTVIDFKTGFYEIKHSVSGLALTVAVAVICAVAAMVARFDKAAFADRLSVGIITPITSGILSIALFYELFVEKFAVQGLAWQVVLMKVVGLLTAAYFAVLAVSWFLKFSLPDMLHALPAVYMIIRIICSFINISSLSLIAENIFLLASYCCALLFFVGYASFYCLEDQSPRLLYMKSVLAFSLCFVTGVSNIVANTVSKGGYTHIPLESQVALTAFSLFIAGFVFEKFLKLRKE